MLAVSPIVHRVIRHISEGHLDGRPGHAPVAAFQVVSGVDADVVVPALPCRPDWADDLYSWLGSGSWLRLWVFLRDVD